MTSFLFPARAAQHLRAAFVGAFVAVSSFVGATQAVAQVCTPVVYAFRHAEDTNPPSPGPIFALTPTGQRHAQLYASMVPALAAANGFCPVDKVYSTTKAAKIAPCSPNCTSATNAFDTGAPLARSAMARDPLTSVGGLELYEYLGNGNDAPDNPSYSTDVAKALRAALVASAQANRSTAIFWTSQGLNVLGGAITGATSAVPSKKDGATPPRNAAYVFVAKRSGGSSSPYDGFSDIDSPTTFVQCFNRVETTKQFTPPGPRFFVPTPDDPVQRYYCGTGAQSNLGGAPGKSCAVGVKCGNIANDDASAPQVLSNKDVLGKICNTTTQMLPDSAGTDILGGCI